MNERASPHLFFLSIPGLRANDLDKMPQLSALFRSGSRATLRSSFPAVTWPAQATLLTGRRPCDHGVVANGFYWRDKREVEMWTAGNEVIESPQIWDVMKQHRPDLTSAAWFPMLSKRCGANYVCMPAPVHNPDGSESLWCYTQPTEFYGDLSGSLQHFPLQHFWGPMANIQSTKWILDSAAIVTRRFSPNFFYIYLPHLDYAAQRCGPDSEAAAVALVELDEVIGQFATEIQSLTPGGADWMAVSEYTIGSVDHVLYPNRLLREAGLLAVKETEQGEVLDLTRSAAWALVDHQFAHIYVQEGQHVDAVKSLFHDQEGVASVLAGDQREDIGMNHRRSGEVIVVSQPNSWQAYYWWFDERQAPEFARTVDIHRKPGYDPVELFWDREAGGVPLDAALVRGSHGAPHGRRDGVLLSTQPLPNAVQDTGVAAIVLGQFAIDAQ
jgi:predicted AlkP superfamily pyrophosphatase or phosphodiesterase